MKKIMILILIIFSISCGSYKKEKFSYNQSEKQTWIDSYKYEAFYGCIKEGIGNDSLRIILNNKDLFNKNVDITFKIADEARLHGKKIISKMPDANIKIDQGEEYLKSKNFVSYNCLVYYASKELDSIANAEYKKYFKN